MVIERKAALGLGMSLWAIELSDLLALVCGLLSPLVVVALGQIVIGEIGLALVAVVSTVGGFDRRIYRDPLFVKFAVLLALFFVALVFADLWRSSPGADLLRGWMRLLVFGLDILALTGFAVRRFQSFWWYLVGFGVGAAVSTLLVPGNILWDWKYRVGIPLTTCGACLLVFLSRPFARVACLVALGILNAALDCRAICGFCLAVAAAEIIAISRARRGQAPSRAYFFLQLLALPGVIALILFASFGRDEFRNRADESNVERYLQLKVGLAAATDSPIIGHGSWAKDASYTQWYLRELATNMRVAKRVDSDAYEIIPSHSAILQGWIEAGLPGLIFFAILFFEVLRSLKRVIYNLDVGSSLPFVVMCLTGTLWHCLLSPFSGQRITFAITVALIIRINTEMRAGRRPRAQVAAIAPARFAGTSGAASPSRGWKSTHLDSRCERIGY